MENINLSLDIINESECNDLGLEIWLDQNKVFDNAVEHGQHHFSYDQDLSEGGHSLQFVLKGKTEQHTQIDEAGNIIKDAVIQLKNVQFDDIGLDQLMWFNATYNHNTNNTSEYKDHKFFGVMGCNGTVTLNFESPVYLWLLENT